MTDIPTCDRCDHKRGNKCLLNPKQATFFLLDCSMPSEPARYQAEQCWEFPPADERCSKFDDEETSYREGKEACARGDHFWMPDEFWGWPFLDSARKQPQEHCGRAQCGAKRNRPEGAS